MKLLKQILDFYLDASIHVSFAVVSLYFISLKILETSTNIDLTGFLFFGTIVCYNFIKYGVEARKYLIVSNPYHKLIQVFSVLSFLFTAYFFFHLDKRLWFLIIVLGFVTALYAVPFLPSAKNLRSLGGMKIFLVALVWTGCTLVLPVYENRLELTLGIIFLIIQRIVLVLILLVPFEIRDLRYDDTELRTLPQRIGVVKTKLITYGLIGMYLVLTFFKDSLINIEIIGNFIFAVLMALVISRTRLNQSKYFASFWVEALPILFLGIWIILEEFI